MWRSSVLVMSVFVAAVSGCGGASSADGITADAGLSIDDSGTTADGGVPEGSPQAWCAASLRIDQASARLDEIDLEDPAAVEAAIEEWYSAIEDAVPVAPEELVDALDVTLVGVGELRAALGAAGWDFLGADLSSVDEMAGEVGDASEAIGAYGLGACQPFVDDSEAEAVGDLGPLREQVIGALVGEGFTQSEAECLSDRIDFTDPDAADDVDQVAPAFESCGIDPARLAEFGG